MQRAAAVRGASGRARQGCLFTRRFTHPPCGLLLYLCCIVLFRSLLHVRLAFAHVSSGSDEVYIYYRRCCFWWRVFFLSCALSCFNFNRSHSTAEFDPALASPRFSYCRCLLDGGLFFFSTSLAANNQVPARARTLRTRGAVGFRFPSPSLGVAEDGCVGVGQREFWRFGFSSLHWQ